jgi:hypothetical protein
MAIGTNHCKSSGNVYVNLAPAPQGQECQFCGGGVAFWVYYCWPDWGQQLFASINSLFMALLHLRQAFKLVFHLHRARRTQ